ncbi:MAG: hypothetical protein M3Z27_07135 [Actinomycetota bacterium]|nr:hypothetical protein [Actinomycetota bacterium]
MRRALILALAGAALSLLPSSAAADSFTPVTVSYAFSWEVTPHPALHIAVSVAADPGVLDPRTGPLRARVKLTPSECGGDFDHTSGTVLLDRVLRPQPDPGEAFQGQATGSARSLRPGRYTVCVYIQDDFKQFATDTSQQVSLTRACVTAFDRWARDDRLLTRALAALHRARGSAARRRLGRLVAQRRSQSRTLLRRALTTCAST